MRLQLALLVFFLVPLRAFADGNVTVTGAYYKERATRVAQPMIDADVDVGEKGNVRGHLLIDSITSASVGAGATTGGFNERRYEVGAGYQRDLDKVRADGAARISNEPDYLSFFGNAGVEIDMADRNTTLGLGGAVGRDTITNSGGNGNPMSRLRENLTTLLATTSLTQLMSQVTLIRFGYDLAYLNGFQANAYRTVFAGGVANGEKVPNERYRHAWSAELRHFINSSGTTLVLAHRLYADNWGIMGNTPELRVIQELSPSLQVHLAYRFHTQNAADFYKDTYTTNDPALEPFLTDDPKLSAMTTHSMNAKIEVSLGQLGLKGNSSASTLSFLAGYIVQSTRFGNALTSQLAWSTPL